MFIISSFSWCVVSGWGKYHVSLAIPAHFVALPCWNTDCLVDLSIVTCNMLSILLQWFQWPRLHRSKSMFSAACDAIVTFGQLKYSLLRLPNLKPINRNVIFIIQAFCWFTYALLSLPPLFLCFDVFCFCFLTSVASNIFRSCVAYMDAAWNLMHLIGCSTFNVSSATYMFALLYFHVSTFFA